MTPSAFLAKHAARVTRDSIYGCWVFFDGKRKNGGLDRDGYGTIWTSEGPRSAHTVAYRELVGEIPAGKVLDHECRRRACCRPDHLNPITGQQNDLMRSWRFRCRRTHCRNGHTLATCITTPEGGRLCRTCAGPGVGMDAQLEAA